jgi:uncharacterized membrane protein YhiD involved in acid resistance
MQQHEPDYKERAVTMGTLGMWIPIGLTVFGLFITSMSIVVSMAVSNATRIAKLEANLEHLTSTVVDSRDDIRRTQTVQEEVRSQLARVQQQQATNNGQQRADSR